MKTHICKFHKEGRCKRGTSCMFAHSMKELREKPDLKFTRMCPAILLGVMCSNPKCTFAHSPAELRADVELGTRKLPKRPLNSLAPRRGQVQGARTDVMKTQVDGIGANSRGKRGGDEIESLLSELVFLQTKVIAMIGAVKALQSPPTASTPDTWNTGDVPAHGRVDGLELINMNTHCAVHPAARKHADELQSGDFSRMSTEEPDDAQQYNDDDFDDGWGDSEYGESGWLLENGGEPEIPDSEHGDRPEVYEERFDACLVQHKTFFELVPDGEGMNVRPMRRVNSAVF